jgi:hypothetical protein
MSMETHVFFRGKLPTKAALSRAMKELDFPFSITPSTGSLERQSGFMPMKRRGEETGVEFDVYNDHSSVEEFADVGVDAGFERRASLRWGGDFQEAVAGMSVAAALAKLMNGVVFDEAEDKLLSAGDAIALARKNLQELVKPEDVKRPGTRPADLKRYLKPLLKQRSDLVLIGRLLVIRPIRHMVRGAFFARTGDKYKFEIVRYIRPLFELDESSFFHAEIDFGLCRVWDPDFLALLFDALDEDIFSEVAKIGKLDDFDRDLGNGDQGFFARFEATVTALLLSGHRGRAEELIAKCDTQAGNNWYLQGLIRNQRALFERDTASLCAECRARESKVASFLQLGNAWEASPFPIEVPAAERAQKCDEPPFPARPWIAPPAGLVNATPMQPGEVRFASKSLQRRSGLVLVVALTREEAEERHRTRQDYVLTMRRPDQSLLVVRHHTGWSPHDPERMRNSYRSFLVELHGSAGRLLQVSIDEEIGRPRVLRMWSMSVYRMPGHHNIWQAHSDTRARTITIHDHRQVSHGYTEEPMTDTEFELCEFAEPGFEDFSELWRRVETFLLMKGVDPLRDGAASGGGRDLARPI